MLDLLVNCDEHFESGRSSDGHQRAVAELFPLHLSCCADFVSRQVFAQPPGQIVVEQNLHGYGFGRSSSKWDPANSSSASACSRETPSKSSRNSSSVWLAASESNKVLIGTRVP